ncbi:MAG TPA: hypothetical protein VFE19_07775 [Jatrophihabitantaceae bacterium]|nr:hypothetical protein [Jatrophihabitantaceae bacterium]
MLSLALGAKYNPTNAFGIVGSALVIMLVSIYIIVDAACIGYIARRRETGFNPILDILVPLLGIAAFVPDWLFAVGWNPFGWSFIASLTYPASLTVRGVVIWMILGVIYLVCLYAIKPARVAEMARVHLGEEVVLFARPGAVIHPALANGAAGVVVTLQGRPVSVMGFAVRGRRIIEIPSLLDPDRVGKLDLSIVDA